MFHSDITGSAETQHQCYLIKLVISHDHGDKSDFSTYYYQGPSRLYGAVIKEVVAGEGLWNIAGTSIVASRSRTSGRQSSSEAIDVRIDF